MQPSKITSIANFLNINTLSTQGTGSLFVVGTALCIVGCLKASPPPAPNETARNLSRGCPVGPVGRITPSPR